MSRTNWNVLKSIMSDKLKKNPNSYAYDVLSIMRRLEGDDEREKRASITECYLEAYGKEPTKSQLVAIASKVPEELEMLADSWGWDDTEVVNKLYKWITEGGM